MQYIVFGTSLYETSIWTIEEMFFTENVSGSVRVVKLGKKLWVNTEGDVDNLYLKQLRGYNNLKQNNIAILIERQSEVFRDSCTVIGDVSFYIQDYEILDSVDAIQKLFDNRVLSAINAEYECINQLERNLIEASKRPEKCRETIEKLKNLKITINE